MMFQSWPTVFDAGPALKQHWVNASCLPDNIVLLHTESAWWTIKANSGLDGCQPDRKMLRDGNLR